MGAATSQRSALEKAAILLQLMGEEAAAQVLQSLPMDEVQRMTQVLMRMEPASFDEASRIAREFTEMMAQRGTFMVSGEDFARSVIGRAFDKASASRLMDAVSAMGDQRTFDALNRVDPKVISEFTRAEHPQTTALILAHLHPATAGKVLSQLPDVVRTEVILRLANIKEVSPTILEEITEALQTDLLQISSSGQEMGGLKKVAEILNHADKKVEEEIITKIQKEDPSLAEGIQRLMFVFDDLSKLEDRAVQEILREVEVKLLAKALRAAGEEVQKKIFSNMSQRAADVLREDIEALGPTRLSDVEEAQMEIVKVTLRLRDEGRVVIQSGGQDDVFV
jgi:flagellar motor switch protein FliG